MCLTLVLQLLNSTREEPGCLAANLFKELGDSGEAGTSRCSSPSTPG